VDARNSIMDKTPRADSKFQTSAKFDPTPVADMMCGNMKRMWLAFLISTAALAQRPGPAPAIVSAVQTRNAQAEYTAEARAANLQGNVSLYVFVDPEGKPSGIKVLHGLGLGLDEKAIEAVKLWQFKPATLDGQPVGLGQSADVPFTMAGGGAWRIRLAAYSVVRNRTRPEVLTKPMLTRYTAPDSAACPAEGGRAMVSMVVGTDGVPQMVTALIRWNS
jgi:TonB family protein